HVRAATAARGIRPRLPALRCLALFDGDRAHDGASPDHRSRAPRVAHGPRRAAERTYGPGRVVPGDVGDSPRVGHGHAGSQPALSRGTADGCAVHRAVDARARRGVVAEPAPSTRAT